MVNQESQVLQFRGGLVGAFAPLAVFITGVAVLALSGAPREVGFWPVLIAALTLGLLACRDRYGYSEALIAGMSQPINMVMILAWLLAGILAELLKESGFVDSMVWLAQWAGVEGAGYVVVAFLIACVISTATGTSLGTLILCTPLLYPAGGPLGAHPAVLLGAILGGATFGDNLSPVSDTTIASSISQGAKLGDVVRTRLRYALPAALVALTFYYALGSEKIAPTPPAAEKPPAAITTDPLAPTGEAVVPKASTPEAPSADPNVADPNVADPNVADPNVAAPNVADPSSADPNVGEPGQAASVAPEPVASAAVSSPLTFSRVRSLPMALAPGLVILLLLLHRHLLEGLLLGNLGALLLGLGLGLLEPSRLLYVDAASYSARGILIDGMEKSVGVAIFTLLLMGLVAGVETSGYMQRLLQYAERKIHTPRTAEWWAFGTVSIATLLTTHSVVALLSVSRFVRETGSRNGVGPNRRANLLDTTVCTYPFLLPYCIPTILAASLSQSGQTFGMPVLTALQAGFYNFHSWALLGMVLLAISTGWGRIQEDPPTTQTPENTRVVEESSDHLLGEGTP